MNSMVSLPIVAALPVAAPAMTPTESPSDAQLVAAANGLLAADEAIEQMHRDHAASGAGGDADELPGYGALEVVRNNHIATLITVPATSQAGIQAKASVVRNERMVEDWDQHQQIAVSLADDLADLNQSVIGLGAPTAVTQTLSEALALVERCRRGDRRWTVLGDQIDEAEERAKQEHGRRPFELIGWRHYSAIGGFEIEGARDEFIRDGIDEKLVQSEYRAAKKRYRAALQAQHDWDCKAGLSDLRKEYEDCMRDTRAAWNALGKVRLTRIEDAVAIIGILRERMRIFEQLGEDWEVAAFLNASRFLIRAAA